MAEKAKFVSVGLEACPRPLRDIYAHEGPELMARERGGFVVIACA